MTTGSAQRGRTKTREDLGLLSTWRGRRFLAIVTLVAVAISSCALGHGIDTPSATGITTTSGLDGSSSTTGTAGIAFTTTGSDGNGSTSAGSAADGTGGLPGPDDTCSTMGGASNETSTSGIGGDETGAGGSLGTPNDGELSPSSGGNPSTRCEPAK